MTIDKETQILSTRWDHFPINRLLPQFSVFNIFFENYNLEDNKSDFLDNHKYLKLREGYFALFACRAFDEVENKEHLMLFTDEDKGDVAFCSKRNDERLNIFQCDVKEYCIKDRNNFVDFLDQISGKSKIDKNQYGLIIAIHKSVEMTKIIKNKLNNLSDQLSRGIFIVSDSYPDNLNTCKSNVIYINNKEILINENFLISNNGNNDVVIYQDTINFL